eukprot:scaffold113650_cov19-Tisochrysis_lutea.AAC.1
MQVGARAFRSSHLAQCTMNITQRLDATRSTFGSLLPPYTIGWFHHCCSSEGSVGCHAGCRQTAVCLKIMPIMTLLAFARAPMSAQLLP